MKLGVAYIVFDGVELLEYAINTIRHHVDYICVIYQTISWYSDKISNEDLDILYEIKNSKLIDDLVLFQDFQQIPIDEFNPVLAKKYEKQKRQLGLDYCRNNGCTHFLCSDVDEFYNTQQFIDAKKNIKIENYLLTAVKYYNYINAPIYRINELIGNVPFICKIGPHSQITNKFFVPCDPTRGVLSKDQKMKNKLLDPDDLVMHHMETVRKDLKKKYISTSRSKFKKKQIDILIDKIKSVDSDTKLFDYNKIIAPNIIDKKISICDNYFNIPYLEWNKK